MIGSNLQSKFLQRMFRRISGLSWDLTTGQIGIQDANGIYTLEITPGDKPTDAPTYRASVNPFDSFGTPIPAFATQVPLNKIKAGDIVVGDKGILGWVIGVRDASLQLMDKNGMTKNFTPPKVQIMGGDGVLVVQDLFSMAGGKDGLNGLQGSLLPLLMLTDTNDSSLEKILPLLLFSQSTGAGAGAMNPMMLLAMTGGLKGGAGGIDPMMLMMMGGMGGSGGMNPMMLMAMTGGLDKLGIGNAAAPITAGGKDVNALGATPALTPIQRR